MKINNMDDKDKELLRRRLKERRLFLNMTYNDLSDKTGISKSSLQRYETGGIKNISYDKIFKLSDALGVSTQYFTDLSNDYTGENDTIKINTVSRQQHLSMIKKFEEIALISITPSLISNGYSVEKYDRGSIGDLVAIKGAETWYIDFLYNRDTNMSSPGTGALKQQFMLRLGRLAIYNKPITKYSIVIQHHMIAEQLLKFKPLHINIEISIIILKSNGYEELFFK